MVFMHSLAAVATTLVLAAALGCGGAQTQPDPLEKLLAAPSSEPAATPAVAPKGSDSGDLSKDQEEQMEVALRRGSKKAANCAEVVPGAAGGSGEIHVLFDGQKGRVTEVTVGPPWVGTPIESCIKRSFVDEIVMPFAGDPRDVPYTIKIGKAADAPDAAKDKDAKDKDAKDKASAKKGKKK